MSGGDKVYKIRNKRTGEWLRRMGSYDYQDKWAVKGGQLFKLRSQVLAYAKHHKSCEVVEYTLSDPRVVTP